MLARSAFQALAGLKAVGKADGGAAPEPAPPPAARERAGPRAPPAPQPPPAPQQYTAWTFGELPELMEVRRGSQTLVGFPALVDRGLDATLGGRPPAT